jgi:kynureninase
MQPTRETAAQLDAADPLAGFRAEFSLPPGVVYLNANSLGPLPAAVPGALDDVVGRQWGERLTRAWNEDDWWHAGLRVGDRIGALIGADAGQTVVGESTSVQIFNALAGAARLRPGRRVILTDADHFPTDLYQAASVARLLGLTLHSVPMRELPASIHRHRDELAVVFAPAVDYRTGELWDIPGLTAAAHEAGALTLWDLCHAAGTLPVRADADGIDLAVGCTYKYLGGGPGSPAYLYAAARHHAALDLPLTGWHGHARPFAMEPAYDPAPGIGRARIGTPPLLSLLALEAALAPFDRAGMAAVHAKAIRLGTFFLTCADTLLDGLGFTVVTPREPSRRAGQITLRHPEALAVMAALKSHDIIGDVRPPDLLRFGFGALHLSYADVLHAAEALRDVTASGAHRGPGFEPHGVVT